MKNLILLSFFLISSSSALKDSLKLEWQLFKDLHSKSYSNIAEELARFTIWKLNLAIIEKHNKLADAGKYSFWLKMNEFTDLVRIKKILI